MIDELAKNGDDIETALKNFNKASVDNSKLRSQKNCISFHVSEPHRTATVVMKTSSVAE
jgi:hypothetical protein